MRNILPVLVVCLVIVVLWYGAALWLNAAWVYDQAARAGTQVSFGQLIHDTMTLPRPKLPAPHQVLGGLWDGIFGQSVTSKKSLVYHGWMTLEVTMLGFAVGTLAGLILAIGIVHSRAMDMSVMPWAIASQTIPVLAIAPMVIVVLASVGLKGVIPKALIAAYLSFFPVLVGMVKGLRAPDGLQLDLMRTYNASRMETLAMLRLPSSLPYLFASLKVGVAAALVGTIVAELPAGASVGLGARLLSGSYYGQTIQIWAALFMAAILAALLVAAIGIAEKVVLKRMGMAR
ncbi:ABC transporter permease [Paenirhodobacter enshiensis]|uniref:ABC transporter permease n=1 Tax=Paenirhodobacter enshiensis TaxID=1105367 RepID=UPI0035AE7BA0